MPNPPLSIIPTRVKYGDYGLIPNQLWMKCCHEGTMQHYFVCTDPEVSLIYEHSTGSTGLQ